MRKDVLSTADIDDSHRNQLFVLSCIALVASGFVFIMGSSVAADMMRVFHSSAQAIGWALGAWSLAFAIAVFVGSPLCDYLGMNKLLALAAICHIVGIVLVIASAQMAGGSGNPIALLYLSWFIAGLGSGLVEAVINPLIATLYPNNKTHKLNVLHAWWPLGLASAGIVAYFVQASKVGGDGNWKICLGIALIPAILYLVMTFGQKFPATERVQAGVSTNDMFKEAFKPLFILWFLCMFGTAALELAPGRWVPAMLSRTVGFPGILLTSYVSVIMFLFRFFAGAISHRFSPVGLMWISSILAGIGLFMLSLANSPVTGLLAATIWAAGVCFMWPTMLGVASERFPRGGALLIGLMGTAGQLSIQFFVPFMGKVYDDTLSTALAAGKTQAQAESAAGPVAFQRMALIAVVLFFVFGAIWLRDKAMGGYQAEQIIADPSKA